MASEGHCFNRFARALGGTLSIVVLGTLICADPAAAQCGPESSGSHNTACGTGALASSTSGTEDSAFGFDALEHNTGGNLNTASGVSALQSNTTGNDNTASGVYALFNNTTGYDNIASGAYALSSNSTGNGNVASGVDTLFYNTTGNDNTASGVYALLNNTTGYDNIASGAGALYYNTTGNYNTTSGVLALLNNTTGNDNIGLGFNAGKNIVSGSNNIDIGGSGTADESNTIRIGTLGTQQQTFIAGISAAPVTGTVVEVNSNGQLGVAMSSARYKHDIRNIGTASAGLMKLRPVRFRYKNDLSGTLQYGLVAEEVERVYPELVTRGLDGKVQSVRYLEFTALLLNELQQQAHQMQQQTREVQQLAERLQAKDAQFTSQQHEIDALKQADASFSILRQRLAAFEWQARANQKRPGTLASE
jgi:Chaperone of endosialidase